MAYEVWGRSLEDRREEAGGQVSLQEMLPQATWGWGGHAPAAQGCPPEGELHYSSPQWALLFIRRIVCLVNRYLTEIYSAEHIGQDGVLPANKLESQS